MDHLNQLMQLVTHPNTTRGFLTINTLLLIIGMVLPFIIGLLFPRKTTIKYGRFVYKWVGKLMLQKRVHTPATDFISSLLNLVRSTFVDLSFGIYLESRADLTSKEKEKKLQEYLSTTTLKTTPKK